MLEEQRYFYEKFHDGLKRGRVECLKQELRLRAVRALIQKGRLPDARILIAGCGSGNDVSVSKEGIVAFDICLEAIRKTKQNFPGNFYLVSDVEQLPFVDNSFDCIVCSEVLEHILYPRKAISEFRRVLNRGGELIITIPNWISWYGLARKLAEFILRSPVTAANQPVDNWYTPLSLRNIIEPDFKIIERRGVWYYPPAGKGHRTIPDALVLPVFRFFQPLDLFLGRVSPLIGSHILAVRCIKNVN